MQTYARVSIVPGTVNEVIGPATYNDESADYETGQPSRVGTEIPIALRYTSDIVAQCFPVPDDLVSNIDQTWTFDGSTFSPYIAPAPSPEQILAGNTAQRAALMSVATNATYGMSDAYQLGLLDDADTATFKAWGAYKLALSKVDLTQVEPTWPSVPTS